MRATTLILALLLTIALCLATQRQLVIAEPRSDTVADGDITLGSPSPIRPTKATCTGCVLIVEFLYNYIRQDSTVEEIISLVSRVCPLLRKEYQEVCPEMIRQMSRGVIEVILERGNPQVVCKLLKLCPKTEGTDPLSDNRHIHRQE